MSKQEKRSQQALFEPVRIGDLELSNRIAMAPLTRSRATEGNVPGPLTEEYYAQRASAGLIVAEATQISQAAQGYTSTPGIHSPEQIAGWRRVTDAVHANGGRIVLQLWHTGRISHEAFQPDGRAPGAPSPVRAQGVQTFIIGQGKVPTAIPRELTLDEIAAVVDDYRKAARNAIEAGFDGVEIHGANGYLIDQFMRDGSNLRTDEYGGSIENRTRFMFEVAQAVSNEIGAGRTGIRISPVSPSNGSLESNPQPLFERAVERLNTLGLAFLHVVEGATGGPRDIAPFDYAALRERFDGAWIGNNGYDREMAIEAVASGRVDMVAFGRAYIFNPDLVRRLKEDAPLNEKFDDVSLYGGGSAHGYTDYPTLDEVTAQ